MNKEEYNNLNSMMKLERENARLRIELKKKEKRIELLEAKLRNQKNTKYADNLGGDDLDLINILSIK